MEELMVKKIGDQGCFVYENETGQWFFFNETYSQVGPYLSEKEAVDEWTKYGDWLNSGMSPNDWQYFLDQKLENVDAYFDMLDGVFVVYNTDDSSKIEEANTIEKATELYIDNYLAEEEE